MSFKRKRENDENLGDFLYDRRAVYQPRPQCLMWRGEDGSIMVCFSLCPCLLGCEPIYPAQRVRSKFLCSVSRSVI